MSQSLHTDDQLHLRKAILSRCVWSDAYSSIKQILKRTDNQLPLLVSFARPDRDEDESILFFDRNVSNKLLFTPLRPTEDAQRQFEVHPRHCTFAATELFKGLFEFVREGRRCARVFSNLEQLVDFTTERKCAVLFMSRDRVKGYFPESNSSTWTSKEYTQGSLFRAERIHRSAENRRSSNDYLECLDEEGYSVFLKMSYVGRYSLVANSAEQQKTTPELYLHSTQTSKIGQLIKRVNSTDNENNCIRLVRGPVPHNFHCQYLRLVRQHTHDVLVGLTGENLVVEWNLESEATCRFAPNLNDILNRLSGTWEEQLLETSIDDARRHYRENFQFDMQLVSTRDWTAFVQYWKWTGDYRKSHQEEQQSSSYPSQQGFHLVASIQDLTDDAEIFIQELRRSSKHRLTPPTAAKENPSEPEKRLTSKQKDFLNHISRSLESNTVKSKAHRISLQNPPPTSVLITPNASPFDNSSYDSNSHSSLPTNQISLHFHKKNARRTQ